MKICSNCGDNKDISQFYLKKNGKLRSKLCRICYNQRYKKPSDNSYYLKNKKKFSDYNKEYRKKNDRKDYYKKYKEENSDKIKELNKEYKIKNKEDLSNKKKEYYQNLSEERKKELREKKREVYHKNNHKASKLKYVKERLENDPIFKLAFNTRSLIRNSIKRMFTHKSKKTNEILGCSFEEFKTYLESKFDENMNWENQGSYWHIDHIIPISSAKTEEEIYKLNHYTNLQPLNWLDNIKKGNKVIIERKLDSF